MSESTLVVIFIGMVAVAWFAMGVVAVLIGMRVIKILDEMQMLAAKVRHTGEAAAADLEELRERLRAEGGKLRSLFDFAVGFAVRKARPRKIKRKEEEEEII